MEAVAHAHNLSQPFSRIPDDLWRRIIRSPALGVEDVLCAGTACRLLNALACDAPRIDLPQRELDLAKPENLEPRPAVGAMLQGLFNGVYESCVFCGETPYTADDRKFWTIMCDHVVCTVCYAAGRGCDCPVCQGPVVDGGFYFPFTPEFAADTVVPDVIVGLSVSDGGDVEVCMRVTEPWIRLRDRMRSLMARAHTDPSEKARDAMISRIDSLWDLVFAACDLCDVGIEDMRANREVEVQADPRYHPAHYDDEPLFRSGDEY